MNNRALVLSILLFCGVPALSIADFWHIPEDTTVEQHVELLLGRMNDEELLGQVLMLGYLGTEPTAEFLSWIRDWNVGGVKIFGWNTADLVELARGIGTMQETAAQTRQAIPLFIATDQEGGWVRHVKGETSIAPGNMAIGASGIAYDSYTSGHIIGTELKILGINMNFAPTVDVYRNPEAHVIGPRAFSSDPAQTAFLSLAFYHGLENAGIISTAKHFPGHGNADEDSHGALPIINDTLASIWDVDLLPYRLLIREGLPSVMSGHLSFPLISGGNLPSSLSSRILRDLLRDKLGFNGIVITDDMKMYGVRQAAKDIPTACEMALLAGNDMVMISRPPEDQEHVRNYLLSRMREDRGFRQLVMESVGRILGIKLRYLYEQGKDAMRPNLEDVREKLPDESGRSFFFDLAFRSATAVRDELFPPSIDERTRILLVGQYSLFFSEGGSRFEDAAMFPFPYTGPTPNEAARLRRMAEEYDILIFCLANSGSLETLKALEDFADKISVLSVLTPVYLREVPWVKSAVAVYGTGEESFKAGFAAIAGDFVPEGKLPFSLAAPGK